MIEQILYINLDSRPDRKEEFCRVMESINGPLPIMKRFQAHDGRDYENRDAIVEAASADGFRFFDQSWFGGKRGSLAYIWSYFTCLRMCVTSKKTTLILFDDRPLGLPVSKVNEILQKIDENEKHPFRILQLNWFNPLDLDQSVSNRVPLSYLEDYCSGFSGHGDQRNIYSPEGAQWMLDAMALLPVGPEEFTGFYSDCRYYLSGIYSYRNGYPNPWITSIDIKDNVQDRIEIDNKDRR